MKKASIETYGILMVVLMALILIFIFLSLEGVFKSAQPSFSYYTQIQTMASQACYSNPATNNINLENPNAIVMQIYDNSTCNASLSSNRYNIFNAAYPYDSNQLINSYDICYANISATQISGFLFHATAYQVDGHGNGQYYYSSPVLNTLQFPSSSSYPKAGAGTYPTLDVSTGDLMTDYGVMAAQAILNSSTRYQLPFSGVSSYSAADVFNVYLYMNKTSTEYKISFYDQSINCYNTVEYFYSNVVAQTISPVNCPSITGITIQLVNPNAVVLLQANVSMSIPSTVYTKSVLSQQCMDIAKNYAGNELQSNSVVCMPINCNGNNFLLTDASQNPKPLLAIISGTFGFFSIQSASGGALKIVNPNPESSMTSALLSGS